MNNNFLNNDFLSYWVYCNVTAHFKTKNFNITDGLVRKKEFISKWNSDRFEHDGKLYHVIGQLYSKQNQLIELYSLYYYKFNSCHPSTIIEDNFEYYKTCMNDLKYFNVTYESDLKRIRKYCDDNNITVKNFLLDQKIFSTKISVFSLIVLNNIFKLTERVEVESDLEKKLIGRKKNKLDKIGIVFYNKLNENYKIITRKILK